MIGPISAQTGLSNAIAQFNTAAVKVSQASQGGDLLDLSSVAVALIQAKNNVALNVKVVQTMDEIEKSLISILG
jgi:hypothetical protein